MLLVRDALEKVRTKGDKEPHAELNFQRTALSAWKGSHLVWDTG